MKLVFTQRYIVCVNIFVFLKIWKIVDSRVFFIFLFSFLTRA